MEFISIDPLPREFYTRLDVVQIARELLGKIVITSFNNELTGGIIIETEAYAGIHDRASHAFNNRRTDRTEIMYKEGGHAYVYLCYGIHSLFNIVTSIQNDPQAVLIRGIEPLFGIDTMKARTRKNSISIKQGIGPGNVTKLLGIEVVHSGLNLCPDFEIESYIWIQDEGVKVSDKDVVAGRRIGIGYAKEDALLPFRFQWRTKNENVLKENLY